MKKKAPAPSLAFLLLIAAALVGFTGLAQTLAQENSLQYDAPPSPTDYSQNVLGDSETEAEKRQQEQLKEASNKTEEQQKETTKNQEEQRREAAKTAGTSNTDTPSQRVVSPTSGSDKRSQPAAIKRETEIETSAKQKIKTKIEDDGTTKVELEHGQLKIKYSTVNGQTVKQIEDEQGEPVELDDDEIAELEDESEQELEDDGLKISTSSGRPSFTKNGVAATTQFPLSIDVGTSQLIVTTSKGAKAVTILPDQAVQNLLDTGIVHEVSSSSPSDSTDTVELKVRKDEPVYEITGTKNYRLFAIIPISQTVKSVVSAETGELITTQQSFLTNIVDLFSF